VTISPDEPSMASFALSPTTLSVVAGRVLTSAGQGALARVSLRPVAPGHALQVGAPLSQASSGSEGVFTIRGVPSGTYVLQAQVNAGPELASYPVVVSGQDVRDLIVTTVQAGSVSGRLSLEGDIGELSPSRLAVQALPMGVGALSGRGGGGPASAGNTATGRANAGGEFAVGALLGRQLLRLAPPLTPDGWWLKAVTVDGKDVTDSGVEIRSGENVNAVEVIATTRMASLTGPVTERSGARVPGCSVVAFAADEAKWGPRTRFVVAGTTDDNGTFLLRGLPAGEYVVVAVPPLEAGDETDPERLARWRPAGQRVTLADGEARSVALTISR
jgi:hypothetical protein